MNNTEIKKALYKQKPIAKLQFIRVGVAYYKTLVKDNEGNENFIQFQVPVKDMGDADYFPDMDAKLLNRYIVE
tara:strand:- start:28 stop:246 length:219 start_codon:yes stop_codon:yes gene_type:complete